MKIAGCVPHEPAIFILCLMSQKTIKQKDIEEEKVIDQIAQFLVLTAKSLVNSRGDHD